MEIRIVARFLGLLIMLIGLLILIPGAVAAIFGELNGVISFFLTSLLMLAFGALLVRTGIKGEIGIKEGISIVSIGWLIAALFGSLPYALLGMRLPDALFESMSAFTTTGSTIMTESNSHGYWIISSALLKQSVSSHLAQYLNRLILSLYHNSGLFSNAPIDHLINITLTDNTYFGLLFWRSFAQWLGGMGVVLLFIAFLPPLGGAGYKLYKVEVSGITKDLLTFRVRETARILWTIYISITAMVVLLLVSADMPIYDAICTGFSTLSTGGFSPQANGIAAYNNSTIEWVVLVFMFLSGTKFALYYQTIKDDRKVLIKDPEFRLYVFIITLATAILVLSSGLEGSLMDKLRLAGFQVVSITTTTGFSTADFNNWSIVAKFILLVLMFLGACAGSSGGAIKIGRILVALKQIHQDFLNSIGSKDDKKIKSNELHIKDEVIHSAISFIDLYLLVVIIATIILAADCYFSGIEMDVIDLLSGVASAMGNVGPGIGKLFTDFHSLPDLSKMVLFFCMWLGRLEIVPILMLFLPEFWKK